jgi:uncharacterized membrane protein YhaH (DUF805 family)
MESFFDFLKMPLKWILPILNPIFKALPESQYFFKCVEESYGDFDGRAGISEYWYYVLAYVVYYVIAGFAITIVSLILGLILSLIKLGALIGIIVFLLGLILYVPLIVPSLAATVRRLHDTGKSGWFIFISVIPFVGSLILLYFMIIDGTPGENQYGKNPKEV